MTSRTARWSAPTCRRRSTRSLATLAPRSRRRCRRGNAAWARGMAPTPLGISRCRHLPSSNTHDRRCCLRTGSGCGRRRVATVVAGRCIAGASVVRGRAAVVARTVGRAIDAGRLGAGELFAGATEKQRARDRDRGRSQSMFLPPPHPSSIARKPLMNDELVGRDRTFRLTGQRDGERGARVGDGSDVDGATVCVHEGARDVEAQAEAA